MYFLLYKCSGCSVEFMDSHSHSFCPECGNEIVSRDYKGEIDIPLSDEIIKEINDIYVSEEE